MKYGEVFPSAYGGAHIIWLQSKIYRHQSTKNCAKEIRRARPIPIEDNVIIRVWCPDQTYNNTYKNNVYGNQHFGFVIAFLPYRGLDARAVKWSEVKWSEYVTSRIVLEPDVNMNGLLMT
jgi:hypothetical protein